MAPKGFDRAVRKLVLLGALAFAAALSGCLGYDGDFDRGYQVDQETVSQIKVGATTKPEALVALGNTVDHVDRRRRRMVLHWSEDAAQAVAFMPVQMTDQHVLAVYFDKGGKVDRESPTTACRTARCSTTSAAPLRPAARSPTSCKQHYGRTVPLQPSRPAWGVA